MNNPMGRKQKGENLTMFSRKPTEPGRILTWCLLYDWAVDGGIVTQKHLNMSIITQLSDGNKPSGCLTSTLIEQELAVKLSYLF